MAASSSMRSPMTLPGRKVGSRRHKQAIPFSLSPTTRSAQFETANKVLASKNHAIAKKLGTVESALFQAKMELKTLRQELTRARIIRTTRKEADAPSSRAALPSSTSSSFPPPPLPPRRPALPPSVPASLPLYPSSPRVASGDAQFITSSSIESRPLSQLFDSLDERRIAGIAQLDKSPSQHGIDSFNASANKQLNRQKGMLKQLQISLLHQDDHTKAGSGTLVSSPLAPSALNAAGATSSTLNTNFERSPPGTFSPSSPSSSSSSVSSPRQSLNLQNAGGTSNAALQTSNHKENKFMVRSSRRRRESFNYREPSLKNKLRQGDKFFQEQLRSP